MLDTYTNPQIAAVIAATGDALADRTAANVAAAAQLVNPIRAAYLNLLDALTKRERAESKARTKAAYVLRAAMQKDDALDLADAKRTYDAITEDYTVIRSTRDAYAELHYTAHTALIAIITGDAAFAPSTLPDAARDESLPLPTTDDLAAVPADSLYAFCVRHLSIVQTLPAQFDFLFNL